MYRASWGDRPWRSVPSGLVSITKRCRVPVASKIATSMRSGSRFPSFAVNSAVYSSRTSRGFDGL
jgi:hypothetical protein